jgi:hypothetical protein
MHSNCLIVSKMNILMLLAFTSVALSAVSAEHATMAANVDTPSVNGEGTLRQQQANSTTTTLLLDCDGAPVVYQHAPPSTNVLTPQAAQPKEDPNERSEPLQPVNAAHFRTEYIDSSLTNLPAARAVLRAPVHTCTIRQYSGIGIFLADHPGIPAFSVQAYAQPPNLNFYTSDDELLERVFIHEEATSSEVAAFLFSRGFSTAPASASM